MIEVACAQLSDEWWEARRGLPTASDFSKIMTPVNRKASGSQTKYMAQLLADITCLSPKYFTQQGGPVNSAVAYGRATENKARRYYEQEHGVTVRQVGFCKTDDGRFGCSPDGLVDPDGGLELKCPERQTHMEYLIKGGVPNEYLCQVHGCLIVSGRKWWDFMSYCEEELPLVVRVVPNEFTMALRVQMELFDKKFQEAKVKYKIKKTAEPMDTPEAIEKAREWSNYLSSIECDVCDGKLTEEQAIEKVNAWLPVLKKYDRPVKVKVYRVLEAWLDVRPQTWHLDSVNLIYRLQEDIAF